MSDPQNPFQRAYQPTQSYPVQPGPADQPYPAAQRYPAAPPYPADQPYPAAQPSPAAPSNQPYPAGQPYPSYPPQYPPYGPRGHPYGGPGPVQPRNGFGVAALALGLVGLALAVVGLAVAVAAFTGFLAVILGGLAVLFGLLGLGRVRSGQANNKVMAIVGAVLGLIAMVVGAIATVLVISTAVRLAGETNQTRPSVPIPSRITPFPPGSPSVPSSVPATPNGQTGPAPGTFTWEDGLAVEVSAPRAVTFSDTACCATSGSGIAFTIRLINNTGKVVAPYAVQTSLTVDGVAAEQVFDVTKNFDAPSNSIPTGRDLIVDVAFDGTGSDLLLEIGGYPYDPALFTATI